MKAAAAPKLSDSSWVIDSIHSRVLPGFFAVVGLRMIGLYPSSILGVKSDDVLANAAALETVVEATDLIAAAFRNAFRTFVVLDIDDSKRQLF
jgi:hypothetical protein